MKIITVILINLFLLSQSLNHFDVKKMIQGNYLHVATHPIENPTPRNNEITITLQNSVSEQFIDEYFANQFLIKNYSVSQEEKKEQIDSVQIKNYLSHFFTVEIKNFSNENYSISHDMGLPMIQEAKDKNGDWQPIEYLELSGNILYHRIKLPTQSKLEIAAPRYTGNFETALRIKIAIQGYGTLISPSFKGSINYKQFKKPKSKKLKRRIQFL